MSASTAPTRGHESAVDDGFTLVEVMVSIAVFSLLVTMMGAITLTAFRVITMTTQSADDRLHASTAMETVSRLLKYTSRPDLATAPVLAVTPTSITFHTYAGSGRSGGNFAAGDVGDVPYRVQLFSRTVGAGTPNARQQIVTRTWAPSVYAGTWGTFTGYPNSGYVERILVTMPASARNPLTISLSQCNPGGNPTLNEDCYGTSKSAMPVSGSTPVIDSGFVPDRVTVSIGDQNDPANVLTQRITLANSIGEVNTK